MAETGEIGPTEFLLVGFGREGPSGAVASALSDLAAGGLVRVIDLAVVEKAGDGTVTVLEAEELAPELASAFAALEGRVRGLMSEADLVEIGEDLAPGTTGAALLVEHAWASRFGAAVRAAGGALLLAERIPHAVIVEARASMPAVG